MNNGAWVEQICAAIYTTTASAILKKGQTPRHAGREITLDRRSERQIDCVGVS